MDHWECNECHEVFNRHVFHCLHCDHHYHVGEDCGNCYKKSGNMPRSKKLTKNQWRLYESAIKRYKTESV